MRKKSLCGIICLLLLTALLGGCGALQKLQANTDEDTISTAELEAAQEAFFTVLDAGSDVWPGTAGSSLRGAAAAGMLLDWSEAYGAVFTAEQITLFIEAWTEASSEDDLANLQEAWESVAASALEMAEAPDNFEALLDDAGYVLNYDAYTVSNIEDVVEAVSAKMQE